MTKVLVFNHHSLPFDTRENADLAISQFLNICIKCRNLGLHTILIDGGIDASWFNIKLSENYYWRDWYSLHNDVSHKELVRAFRSIRTNQLFFSNEDIDKDVELFEVVFGEITEYTALKAAAWNGAPLASFPSTEQWEKSPLPVLIRTLDQEGSILENRGDIVNLYNIEIYRAFQTEYLKERNALISRASEVFKNWDEMFPNLSYCGKVKEQLLQWSASNTLLSQVIESLTVLNAFSEQWKKGELTTYSHEGLRTLGLNHPVSGESNTVKNNPVLRRERNFWLPTGEKALFENHIKLSQGYRIHFFPQSESKTIFVAYIGKHLKLS